MDEVMPSSAHYASQNVTEGVGIADGRSLRAYKIRNTFRGQWGSSACLHYRTLPQSPAVTAFGPGRKHGLLPALAKNMPPAYFLNASRPPGWSLSAMAKRLPYNPMIHYAANPRLVCADYEKSLTE